MSSDLQFIFVRTRVAVIQRILKTTVHNAYPVVSIVHHGDVGDISINHVSKTQNVPFSWSRGRMSDL